VSRIQQDNEKKEGTAVVVVSDNNNNNNKQTRDTVDAVRTGRWQQECIV